MGKVIYVRKGINMFLSAGATHNRFEHSIGVCHLAGKMIDKLAQQVHISSVDKICVKVSFYSECPITL